MERRFVVVAVAIVLLAGCSALGGGASNAAPTTTTQQDGGTIADIELPDGIGENGVEDARNLVIRHRSVVTNDSYTFLFEKTVNGTTTKSRVAVEPGDARSLSRFEQSESEGTHVIYQSDGTRYVKNDLTVNETQYAVENASFAAPITVGKLESFRYMLEQSDYENPTAVDVAGESAVRFEIVGFRGKDIANGSLTVTESGVIHEFELTLEMDNETYEYAYAMTDRGRTEVTEPGWLEKAESRSENNTTAESDETGSKV